MLLDIELRPLRADSTNLKRLAYWSPDDRGSSEPPALGCSYHEQAMVSVTSPLHSEPLFMPMADEINPRMLGEWLAGMSLPERARNLNRISYDLTVCAREFEAVTQP